MSDYYKRENIVHLDGTTVFQTEDDRRSEAEVAVIVEAHWKCSLRRFGALSPIDWYAERLGRVVGFVELKSRLHTSTTYQTVFLNVRKWLALQLATAGLGPPSIFVVRFLDVVLWVPVSDIDGRKMRVGGCIRIVKADSDIEPIIEVPIRSMKVLGQVRATDLTKGLDSGPEAALT